MTSSQQRQWAFERAPRLMDTGTGEKLAVQLKGQGPTVVLEGPGPGVGIGGWGKLDELLAV